MDFITIGGIAAVIIVVLAACFFIYKVLTRETTFEEAYGNGAIKLLASQQQNTDKTKPKAKRHHPKRKHSPKGEPNQPQPEQEKGTNSKSQESPINEPVNQAYEQPKSKSVGPKSKEKEEPKVEPSTSSSNEQTAKQQPKSKNAHHQQQKSSSNEEMVKLVEVQTQQKTAVPDADGMEEKKVDNTPQAQEQSNGQMNGTAMKKDLVAEGGEQPQPQQKKSSKKQTSVSAKDLSLPKVIERLKDVGELEREYVVYLQNNMEEFKAKETKFRDEVKQAKAEKGEMDKGLKQLNEQLEKLRAENVQLTKDKKEQSERHVVFEQTVRNQLIQSYQQKEENIKLVELVSNLQTKNIEAGQMLQQMPMLQTERKKACEERDLANRKCEEMYKNIQANMEHQGQMMQAEVKKERDERTKVEHEYRMVKGMLDKLMADLNNKENQLRDVGTANASFEGKLQALQSELSREKERNSHAEREAQTQIGLLSRDVEQAMVAYQTLKAQQSTDGNRVQELASVNQALQTEVDRLKSQAETESKSSADSHQNEVAELAKQLEEQRARNQELRDANSNLVETVKQLQSANVLVNGTGSGPTKESTATAEANNENEIRRLKAENSQYKQSLDLLRDQLAEVARIAQEMEQHKDAKIAQIEQKLTSMFNAESS